MQRALRSASWILPAALAFAGCGLVSDNFDAELKVPFTVDETGSTFRQELAVNPQDYKDVKDNCSAVEKSTGQIRTIEIEVEQTMPNNMAQFGSGLVFMKQAGSGEWPDETPSEAFATFDRVPLLDGQIITLEMTPARKAQLANLVFTENCDKAVELKMVGESDSGPVSFSGEVRFIVDFVASI